MTRVLVTGASGNLGRLTLDALLRRRDAGAPVEVLALARRPDAVADLSARGVEVRFGDYVDEAAMRAALAGVDRLLLVSAPTFTDRAAAHRNVIRAAEAADVGHVTYTSVQGVSDGRFDFSQVTASDRATIDALHESGLATTVAYNSLFLDSLLEIVGDEPSRLGTVTAPAGDGAVAAIARRDLAEAYAAILLSAHPDASCTLTGPRAVTMAEVAASVGARLGRDVTYRPVTVAAFVAGRADVPKPVAAFFAEWYQAIAAGEFPATGDYAALVGHPAATVEEFVSATHTR